MTRTFIIGEIGINHNGNLNLAKELIKGAKLAGADAVKFQKRTVDKVYTPEFLASPRNDGNPYGWKTQGEQKYGIEFTKEDYDEIDKYCKEIGIIWFASSWDVDSQLFLRQYKLMYNKVASAMLTNLELLRTIAEERRYTFISTGMSSWEEIDKAVEIFREYNCPFELMHCIATYPMDNKDANLRMINTLKSCYSCRVGYSCHSKGRIVPLMAVGIGATSLEKHITLDKTMYGSDQSASLELSDFEKLIVDIRGIEQALGTGEKVFSEAELAIRKKLRGV